MKSVNKKLFLQKIVAQYVIALEEKCITDSVMSRFHTVRVVCRGFPIRLYLTRPLTHTVATKKGYTVTTEYDLDGNVTSSHKTDQFNYSSVIDDPHLTPLFIIPWGKLRYMLNGDQYLSERNDYDRRKTNSEKAKASESIGTKNKPRI
jgi:hypothetical protein